MEDGIVEAFERAERSLAAAISALSDAERMCRLAGRDLLAERCRLGVRSYLEMAQSNEHLWLAGNAFTLAGLIEEATEGGEG